MPAPVPEHHPLRQLFRNLVYQVFVINLGIYEPGIPEYLANLLTDFVHIDNIFRIRNLRGKPIEEVAEMLMEADIRLNARSFNREREVHKHIGDFTLFWTGVYPEALRYFRAPTRKDHLIDYVDQGKKSYHIASLFDYDPYKEEARILRQLSQGFELCMYGLNMVRREWEKLRDPSFRRFQEGLLE